MKTILLLPLAAAPLFLNSCATVIQGKSEMVVFDAVQKGASVEVDGAKHKTPATVEISKKTSSATFSHPKYPAKKIEWKRNIQKGYVLLNIIVTPGWGSTGIATDTATGALWDQPQSITYDFKSGQVALGKFGGNSRPPKDKKAE